MKTTILKMTFVTLLLVGFHTSAAAQGDDRMGGGSAATEGGVPAVNDCLLPGGACYDKVKDGLATQNPISDSAIIHQILNGGTPPLGQQSDITR